jgi:Nucleosome binding factor SPN, SPT16 subunit
MKLVLTPHGTAELLDAKGNRKWSSDDDEQFDEEFGEDFVRDEDSEEVIEYLADEGYLSHDELDDVVIEIQSLEGQEDGTDEEMDDEIGDDWDDEDSDDGGAYPYM